VYQLARRRRDSCLCDFTGVKDLLGERYEAGRTLQDDEPLGAEMRRALRQYTRDARIGLVPASRMGLRGVSEIAPALVGNPFWDFWWD
jgi:hypothetical protein